MHIVHLIDTLERGGAEQACVHLCNGLAAAGHRVTLLATRSGGPLIERVTEEVRIEVLDKRSLLDRQAHRRLRDLARGADVVHAHSSSVYSAVRALWRDTVPIVWHDHFGGPQPMRPLRLVRRRLSAALVASTTLGARANAALDLEAHWFPNAVPEPDEMDPIQLVGIDRTHHRLITCVANFRPEKNHTGLIEALAPLLEDRGDLRLLLVGAGGPASTRPTVENRIAALGLSSAVMVLGERDDVPAILAASEIGVLASHFEALPLTLLEYGWAALGVVAPAVGQIPQLLGRADGAQRGLDFPPGDQGALCGAVRRLIDDPAECRRLGSALRQHVSRVHSVHAAVARLERLYGALI